VEGPHDFDEIWRADGPTLWRAVYGFTGGRRDVADDAVAEAFARAMARGGKVRDPLAYLFRIAFRVAGAELARRSKEVQDVPEVSLPDPTQKRVARPARRLAGALALKTPKADVEWERFGDSRVIVMAVEDTIVMLGPVVCNEGGTVATSWLPSATYPDSIDLAQWDVTGRPAPGNAPGFHEVLPVHSVIRAWDGTLLSSLDMTS